MNVNKEVSAYIRASTNQQQLTLAFQKRKNIEAAQNLGIILKEENIFTDAGVSGFKIPMEQRKNLQAMLKKAKKGEVSHLIVFKRDRLTRRAREYLKIAHSLQEYGVQIIFSDPAEHPFITDYGWMVECVFAALLQKECEGIREKVILGLKTSHSMGLWTGGQPGFGFQYDKNSKKLNVIREESAAVKQIIHLLANGKSPQEIAQLLNKQNTLWAARNGKTGKWTTAKIKQIGSNPLFLGISERFGEKVHLKDQKPIVDMQIWQQAQETLEKYAPASRSKNSKKKAAFIRRPCVLCAKL